MSPEPLHRDNRLRLFTLAPSAGVPHDPKDAVFRDLRLRKFGSRRGLPGIESCLNLACECREVDLASLSRLHELIDFHSEPGVEPSIQRGR
jgi:hypothetical protein